MLLLPLTAGRKIKTQEGNPTMRVVVAESFIMVDYVFIRFRQSNNIVIAEMTSLLYVTQFLYVRIRVEVSAQNTTEWMN